MKPLDVVNDVCRYYICDSQDVEVGLKDLVLGYLRSRNYPALASCAQHFDQATHTISEFRFLRQIEAFYKKNALLASGAECKSQALATFIKCEEQCSETNRRLGKYIGKEYLLDKPFDIWIPKMQRYISSVLGNFDSFINALPSLVKVTAGATASSARRDSLPQIKMRLKPYCTPRSEKYLYAIYRSFGFTHVRFKTTHLNRVETVPKNWKTDRTIACEAEGNLPLQLAFDTYAKRRLRHFGINLRSQFANQRAAFEASKVDGDVTVDHKTASDTVAYNTVSWLFPVDWFRFLRDVRSPGYRSADLGRGVYAKFSSMGNGSTFTIETLLFAAACYAVGSRKFLVYGDDVIIDKEHYEAYKLLTGFLGFLINDEKTFVHGPFRESCGLDVYNGINVTPVYIRQLDGRKACKCHFVNTLLELTFPGSKLMMYLASLVKDWQLPLVPYQEGTMTGVWIDPTLARKLGILKQVRFKNHYTWREVTKVYVAETETRNFVDSRGYYLWFLRKHGQVLFKGPWDLTFRSHDQSRGKLTSSETSRVPIFRHAYVRKWVSWFPADGLYPTHLSWWSELMTRPKGLGISIAG